MTRPPDFDLTTVEGIVSLANSYEWCCRQAAMWAREHDHCKAEEYAHHWATEAAHHTRRLQGVAELVSVSGDLAAWQEWRERGKA